MGSGTRETDHGISFRWGPYDGIEIDGELLNRYARIIPVPGPVESRLFVLLPSREDWARLLRGEALKPEEAHLYERHCADGETWFEAKAQDTLERASSASRIKVHARARTTLAALSPSERRQVIEVTDGLQREEPSAWPADRAQRLAEDPSVYLLTVSEDLLAFVRTRAGGEIELLDVLYKDTLDQLLESIRHAGVRG